MKTFSHNGITFQYPDSWMVELESSEEDSGWAVTVQSPGMAFCLVSLRTEADTPTQVLSEALATLKAEYKDVEAEETLGSLSGRPMLGYDLDFLAVDTSITCWLRSVDTVDGPLLILAQVSEFDRDDNEPALHKILTSLQCEDI
ncbi:MAG: hypothetical protein ACRC8S_22010 [Fimbriiglobus sp.]